MMKKCRIYLSLTIVVISGLKGIAQIRKDIRIPDIPGYITLKCDFHMHTIFSDGKVWPGIRVEEAWRDGLDVISITDHLNYKWSFLEGYINSNDLNTAYNIAKLTANRMGIVLIKGAEINRDMAPGHFNILFAEDLNQLTDSDFFLALNKAKGQGAFIQWNHPGIGQKKPFKWFNIHDQLYNQGLINGIEVYNQNTFYPEAVTWASDKNLTVTANSDIHELIDMVVDKNSHRPITLVFAKDRSIDAIRDAMFKGRTIAYFDNRLVGHLDQLQQLFNAAVKTVDLPMIIENKKKYIEFRNNSDIDFELELFQEDEGAGLPQSLRLDSNCSKMYYAKPNNAIANSKLFKAKYIVKNLISISGENVIVEFIFKKIGVLENHPYLKKKYPKVN